MNRVKKEVKLLLFFAVLTGLALLNGCVKKEATPAGTENLVLTSSPQFTAETPSKQSEQLETLETSREEKETLAPLDSLQQPSRGFFMGVLPSPAQKQSFEEAYAQAAKHSELVPVWGRPTPFYNLAKELSGEWGQTFVKQLIRRN